ncbi:MAG: reverse transcriptase domain-containing protein [Pseudomonadota bacterium]|nr:reverse transcriptase domain-containing protein [Pseudomonadota bacterium]
MPVQFENYTHSFTINSKPVFAPSELGRKIGEDIKEKIESVYAFDPFYFHLIAGGHVGALHGHRENEFFCKADIENFFYSVSRNRVVRTLREIGVPRPKHYGKWSCVKNPYGSPSYALPYGFVQSPILASLVLSTSAVGNFLRSVGSEVTVAVYVDGITASSNDDEALNEFYEGLLVSMRDASLPAKAAKCVPPTRQVDVFNCSLERDRSEVLAERRDLFFSVPRSPASQEGFEHYCERVVQGNK